MSRKSLIKRFICRWLIAWLMSVPEITILCVWTHVMKPNVDENFKECNVLRYMLIAYFLRIILWFLAALLIFAYLDSICLHFKLYDRAPTLDYNDSASNSG